MIWAYTLYEILNFGPKESSCYKNFCWI